jgi:predicted metal-dependent hydrolase
MRVAVMWLTHVLFVLETSMWTAISLVMDGEAWRHPVAVVRSISHLRDSPFTQPRAVRQLFQYHQRGFHPHDRDTSDLIADWRKRFFGPEGQLIEIRAAS